ncbi:hypothetical protein CPB84DRAFT_1751060 [Gymnopilus junonius]|uniref:Uncharacterized protein n=1 Tax=Gymnopilus junonius TaxID=109634 RepID=A0A9P5NFA1_GYMJU|nr:hypothetical protein CPB84DRAFT_1754346 [Gymnopilus junonius]KAF8879902.1 hypothetical protein CPB84DRAFT_1751556 [Gymnopilus junonius]KAF8881966.1 hypothetical protein CPB84DRAFT_1751060 [Gymnopilus junonius]
MPRKIPIHASKRVKYFAFRGRLYRQNEDRPFFANIMIQDTAPKLKQMHSAFGDIFPRSYIYDYRVVILEGRSSHEFQISCKKTIGLEYNKVLQKLGGQWNGDIVVMRIGKKNPSNPVDMGGKDAGRATSLSRTSGTFNPLLQGLSVFRFGQPDRKIRQGTIA